MATLAEGRPFEIGVTSPSCALNFQQTGILPKRISHRNTTLKRGAKMSDVIFMPEVPVPPYRSPSPTRVVYNLTRTESKGGKTRRRMARGGHINRIPGIYLLSKLSDSKSTLTNRLTDQY